MSCLMQEGWEPSISPLKNRFYVTKCLKSILIVKKKNKVTVLMLQDFKTYYKAIIMKIVRER